MKRERYNLGHQTHRCGMIGRRQLVTMVPVIAGDSLELSLDAILRLSPLRKEIVQEGIIDIHAFYVPHRHIYGDQIVDMVKEGFDEAQTLTGISIDANGRNPVFLGMNTCGAALPKWMVQGPNRIWDRYYRVPTLPRIEDGLNGLDDYPITLTDADINTRLFGPLCARLPSPLNGGTDVNSDFWSSQDLDNIDAQVSAATDVVDLRDIAKQQSRFASEIKRTWMANDRYTDVLDEVYGTNVNIDADQRPELLWGDRSTFSGHDVNGTDDATLGSYIGKTVARVNWRMPRKFFAEHGIVWVFALVRFPLIHGDECHPLMKVVNPTGEFLLADPKLWADRAPVNFTPGDWLSQQASVAEGAFQMPFGQHYRVQPNFVHSLLTSNEGYPFENQTMQTAGQFMYHSDNDYDDTFKGESQLGHWQLHGTVDAEVLRQVPPAINSIMAGTKL